MRARLVDREWAWTSAGTKSTPSVDGRLKDEERYQSLWMIAVLSWEKLVVGRWWWYEGEQDGGVGRMSFGHIYSEHRHEWMTGVAEQEGRVSTRQCPT